LNAPEPSSALTRLAGVPPRVRHALFGLIAVLTAANVIGTALSPYLVLEHPLLLIALSPDGRHVVLVAGAVPTTWLVVLGTARRFLALVAGFGLGALYGDAAVTWAEQRVPRLTRVIRFIERLFERFGLFLFALAPLPGIAVLAGAARTRFVLFALAGVLGQAAWIRLTVEFGEAVSAWTQPILAFVSRHVVATTVVVAALVALQQWVAHSKRSARPKDDA